MLIHQTSLFPLNHLLHRPQRGKRNPKSTRGKKEGRRKRRDPDHLLQAEQESFKIPSKTGKRHQLQTKSRATREVDHQTILEEIRKEKEDSLKRISELEKCVIQAEFDKCVHESASKTPDFPESPLQQKRSENPKLKKLTANQLGKEPGLLKTHYQVAHNDVKEGQTVIIDRSGKAINKIFKLKGYKLQIDDRIRAFITASEVGDDEVESFHLKDVADFMQVQIPEPKDVISKNEAFAYLEAALKPLVKLHDEVNPEN